MYCELLTFKHEVSLGKQFHQPFFFCCCHPFGLVTPTFIVKISRSNKEITKPPYHMCMHFRVLKNSLDAVTEKRYYGYTNSKVKIAFLTKAV